MKNLLKSLLGGGGKANAAPAAAAASAPSGFEAQNDLERLLVVAARDPAGRADFEAAMLAGTLYAATPEPPVAGAEGWRTTQTDEEMALLNVAGPDGSPMPAAFTSPLRVAECFGAGAGYVAMQGSVLLGLFEAGGTYLNPGSAYGVQWDAAQLAGVLGKPVQRTIEEETQVLLGSPAQPPHALMAAITGALTAEPRIEEAWFAMAQWPDGGQAWYLDIRSGLDADTVMPLLSGVLAGPALEGRAVDIVVNPPGADDGAGIRLIPAQA
jgi:hypothetical protein